LSPERIVLIGFMASGKTEVGRELAERLGWRHVDLDEEISRREGCTIAEIFESRGEAAFRALEVEVTAAVASESEVVISTGGGWVTNAGLHDSLPPGTLTVLLRVSPTEVLRRIAAGEGQPVRPLLATEDPTGRVTELMAAREPLYNRADLIVETEHRSVRRIAEEIRELMEHGRRSPS
jgi:shikimate kinase